MDYICLRDCVVGDKYFHQGQKYRLDDSRAISPKNFRVADEDEAPETEAPAKWGEAPDLTPQEIEEVIVVGQNGNDITLSDNGNDIDEATATTVAKPKKRKRKKTVKP